MLVRRDQRLVVPGKMKERSRTGPWRHVGHLRAPGKGVRCTTQPGRYGVSLGHPVVVGQPSAVQLFSCRQLPEPDAGQFSESKVRALATVLVFQRRTTGQHQAAAGANVSPDSTDDRVAHHTDVWQDQYAVILDPSLQDVPFGNHVERHAGTFQRRPPALEVPSVLPGSVRHGAGLGLHGMEQGRVPRLACPLDVRLDLADVGEEPAGHLDHVRREVRHPLVEKDGHGLAHHRLPGPELDRRRGQGHQYAVRIPGDPLRRDYRLVCLRPYEIRLHTHIVGVFGDHLRIALQHERIHVAAGFVDHLPPVGHADDRAVAVQEEDGLGPGSVDEFPDLTDKGHQALTPQLAALGVLQLQGHVLAELPAVYLAAIATETVRFGEVQPVLVDAVHVVVPDHLFELPEQDVAVRAVDAQRGHALKQLIPSLVEIQPLRRAGWVSLHASEAVRGP